MSEDIFAQLEPLAERLGQCMDKVNATLANARIRLKEISLGMSVKIPLTVDGSPISLAYMRHHGIWDLYIIQGNDDVTNIVEAGMMNRFYAANLIPELVSRIKAKAEKLLEGME